MHEHPIKVTRFHRPDLNGLVTPTHNLTRADEGDGGRHLSPLQHHILGHLGGGGRGGVLGGDSGGIFVCKC